MVPGVRSARAEATPGRDADGTTRSGNTGYKVATTVRAGTHAVHEAERFKIEKSYITEIEIIAHVEIGRGGGSGWLVECDAAVKK